MCRARFSHFIASYRIASASEDDDGWWLAADRVSVNEKFTQWCTRYASIIVSCATFSCHFLLTSSEGKYARAIDFWWNWSRKRTSLVLKNGKSKGEKKWNSDRAVNQSSFNGALSFPFGFTFHGKYQHNKSLCSILVKVSCNWPFIASFT